MKLTIWDQLVRVVTGKLPKKTQIEFDKHEARELEELTAYIAKIRQIAAEETRKAKAEGLVKNKETSTSSKKKTTSKTKKAS